MATLRSDVHIADDVRDTAGTLTAATLTWVKAGNRKLKDWDNTTLGTLRLEGSRLLVEVNSARRRRRIEKEIAKRLGTAATLVDTTVTDLAEALEQRRETRSLAPPHLSTPADSPSSPELHALETELARKHWDAWLDTKVPALGLVGVGCRLTILGPGLGTNRKRADCPRSCLLCQPTAFAKLLRRTPGTIGGTGDGRPIARRILMPTGTINDRGT